MYFPPLHKGIAKDTIQNVLPVGGGGKCPYEHGCCPLSSTLARPALLFYLVSVASPPHHLQATHLFFGPTLAEPKHFLMVTQPPRRTGKRERESSLGGEGGKGMGGRGGARSGSQPRDETHHGIFPSLLPCPALFWSDSSPTRPRGSFCQGSASHAILVPHPTAHLVR